MGRFAVVLALLGTVLAVASAAPSLQEQQALVDIANAHPVLKSLSYHPWNISAPERACTDWNGVVCFFGTNVTYLRLSGFPIDGPLTPAIGNLKALTDLYVGDCGVTLPVPDEILSLPELKTLDFTQNAMAGPIPDFSRLTKLKSINLEYCDLNGPLPESLFTLPLETLVIVNLNVSELPNSISNLVNLTTLYLVGTTWSGTVPAAVWTLPKLQTLYLSGAFTGTFPASVSLPSLKSLRLQYNQITGPLPSGLSAPLEEIYFNSNPFFSGSLPADWGNISTLQKISIGGSPLIAGPIPASFGNLVSLKSMSLSSCRLNGTLPAGLFDRMTNLETFDLSANDLTGPLPATGFAELIKLTSFNVRNNRFVGSFGSVFAAPMLKSLYVSSNFFEGTMEVVGGVPQKLQTLEAGSNRLTKLPDNIGTFPALTLLRVSTNRLAGTVPASIGQSSTLAAVDLSYNMLTGDLPNFRRDRNWQSINFRSNAASYCWIEPPTVSICYMDQNPNLCVCGQSVCSGNICSNCTISNNNSTCLLSPQPNGFPTTVPSRCASGISSNGHCCGTSCSQCESCATGTCATVADGPFSACTVACSNYVAGWSGLTCNVFRDDIFGNCTAGVCNAGVQQCASASGIALPTPEKTCASASCQRPTASSCVPLTLKTNWTTLSTICFVNEAGNCATGTCDSTARCPIPPALPPTSPSGSPSSGANGTPSGGNGAPSTGANGPSASGGAPGGDSSAPNSSNNVPSNTKASPAAEIRASSAGSTVFFLFVFFTILF